MDSHKNTFIGHYVTLCQSAEQSLSVTQIGLLEQTIEEFFGLGVKAERDVTVPLVSEDNRRRPVDGRVLAGAGEQLCYSQPGRLISIITQYRAAKGDNRDPDPITDGDVFDLYQETAAAISEGFPTLKKRYGLPKIYGIGSFRVLHIYLQRRGMIDKSRLSPLPPPSMC